MLERVEQFCELERQELFGVEPGDAIRAIEPVHRVDRVTPQLLQVGVGFVHAIRDAQQRLAEVAVSIDAEVSELLFGQGGGVVGLRGVAQR